MLVDSLHLRNHPHEPRALDGDMGGGKVKSEPIPDKLVQSVRFVNRSRTFSNLVQYVLVYGAAVNT